MMSDQILLQRRSKQDKMWPDEWDLSVCGHVASGELPIKTAQRELSEELGLDVPYNAFELISIVDSENIHRDNINRHRNYYFVYRVKDIELESLRLQETEVAEVKWVDKEDIIERIKNNFDGITNKKTAWNCLLEYYNRENELPNKNIFEERE